MQNTTTQFIPAREALRQANENVCLETERDFVMNCIENANIQTPIFRLSSE